MQADDRPTRTLPTNAMSEYDWAVYTKLCETAQGLVGKHTTDYDKRLPSDRLGCVKAVSMLVDQAFGYNTNDVNTRTFEKDLRDKGFAEVAVSDIKPGDVILGYRADGDYSHSALYMGNGKIFNNDSDAGTMQIQSIDKFNSTEFKRFVILRHPPKVPGVTGAEGKNSSANSTVESGQVNTSSQEFESEPATEPEIQTDERATYVAPQEQRRSTAESEQDLNVPDPEQDFEQAVPTHSRAKR